MDCSLYHHLKRSGTVPRANTLSYHACTGFITTDHELVDEGTLLMAYKAIVRGPLVRCLPLKGWGCLYLMKHLGCMREEQSCRMRVSGLHCNYVHVWANWMHRRQWPLGLGILFYFRGSYILGMLGRSIVQRRIKLSILFYLGKTFSQKATLQGPSTVQLRNKTFMQRHIHNYTYTWTQLTLKLGY